jgi:hypothetical protein
MTDQPTGIVYLLHFPASGKGYVGQTRRTLEQRVREHQNERSACRALRAAIRKYGTAGFVASVLKRVPVEELDFWETQFVRMIGTLAPAGYNLVDPGEARRPPDVPPWTPAPIPEHTPRPRPFVAFACAPEHAPKRPNPLRPEPPPAPPGRPHPYAAWPVRAPAK